MSVVEITITYDDGRIGKLRIDDPSAMNVSIEPATIDGVDGNGWKEPNPRAGQTFFFVRGMTK